MNLGEKLILFKLKKLCKKKDIKSLKVFIRVLFNLNEYFPDSFYHSLIIQVLNNNTNLLKYFANLDIMGVISTLKNMEYLNCYEKNITPYQYYSLSVKQIKQVISMLKKIPKENELDDFYKNEIAVKLSYTEGHFLYEINSLACKILVCLGYDNTIDLLKGKYGDVSLKTLHFLFSNMELKNAQLIREDFTHFLFGNKKDMYNNMRLLLMGKCKPIYLNFAYFYENFAKIKENLGDNMSRGKVELILGNRYLPPNIEHPEIGPIVMDDMIHSYYNKDSYREEYDKNKIEEINMDFYEKIAREYVSSIPELNLKINNYYFSIIPRKDAKLLTMGYRTNNCFRLNGEAFILFKRALLSKHMRVVSISTDNKKDIAMMLIGRNGNVIISQGIEISKECQSDYQNIFIACKTFLKELMNYINKQDDEVVATIIGGSNSNVLEMVSEPLNFRITPIIMENNSSDYYDGFHFYQYLLDLRENKNINDIKLFVPNPSYLDKRCEVIHAYGYYPYKKYTHELCNSYYQNETLCRTRILSICLQSGTQLDECQKFMMIDDSEIYSNVDWFLIVTHDGDIKGICLDYDKRAREEYEYYYEKALNDIKTRKLKK